MKMKEINIDAKNLIVGRLGAYAAKQALLGNVINIFNSEKAVMTGNKRYIFQKYYQRMSTGRPTKGPFIFRQPDRFLKRQIRNMVSFEKPRGAEALRRIKCYVGVPEKFQTKKLVTLKEASADNKTTLKITQIAEICKMLGGKV